MYPLINHKQTEIRQLQITIAELNPNKKWHIYSSILIHVWSKHQQPQAPNSDHSNESNCHPCTYYPHNPRNNHESTGITHRRHPTRRHPPAPAPIQQIGLEASKSTTQPHESTHPTSSPPVAQIRTHTNRIGTARRMRRRREQRAHLGGRMMKLTSWSIGRRERGRETNDESPRTERERRRLGTRSKQATASLSSPPFFLIDCFCLDNCLPLLRGLDRRQQCRAKRKEKSTKNNLKPKNSIRLRNLQTGQKKSPVPIPPSLGRRECPPDPVLTRLSLYS